MATTAGIPRARPPGRLRVGWLRVGWLQVGWLQVGWLRPPGCAGGGKPAPPPETGMWPAAGALPPAVVEA